MTNTSNQ